MGIVLNQSLKNTIITYVGFGIGGLYTLYLFPVLLGATYYALTNYILSSANVIMPLFAIGMQNTLVKFYSQYETETEREQFLSFTVLFPLLMCIPIGIIGLLILRSDLISNLYIMIGIVPPGILYLVYWFLSKEQKKTLEKE